MGIIISGFPKNSFFRQITILAPLMKKRGKLGDRRKKEAFLASFYTADLFKNKTQPFLFGVQLFFSLQNQLALIALLRNTFNNQPKAF